MLFDSIQFVLFLPAVVLLYYLIPWRYRWMLLLVSSYLFYMSWKAEFVLLILTSTIINYFAAIEIEKHPQKPDKRLFMFISLLTNLGLLGIFKYFNFISGTGEWFFAQLGAAVEWPYLDLILPVGISFYTLQSLSYMLDVYQGKQVAEKHFGHFAAFVSFFPKLIAGPIERYAALAPQFRVEHRFSRDHFIRGMRLILYGLFLKMVVADNLAVHADLVFSDPGSFYFLDILTGMLFYSFRIYGDFYAYSIIAIGSAMLLGIQLMDNFKTPYLSRSISEFWHRWHISLSLWFRDYLYFPMGGNRGSKVRWILNILTVFLVSGLWHGANWTFVFWGGVFGIAYLIERLLRKRSVKPDAEPLNLKDLPAIIITFLVVTFAWVFFRSPDIGHAFSMFSYVFSNMDGTLSRLYVEPRVWIFLVLFIISDRWLYGSRFDLAMGNLSGPQRWVIYALLIFSIIVFSAVEYIPFIYFQM